MSFIIVWLIVGIALVVTSISVTLIIWRRVSNPERLVTLIDDAVARRRDARDPDTRRAGMRWPVMVIPGFWFLALLSWPRTIDHLIRGEWNVITSGPESAWSDMTFYALLGCIGLCVLMGFTIGYWNQPKFLVHPYFHSDPGLLRARRLRAQGVDVDELYETSAERWRELQRRR
jgi:hypothetical protein